MEANEKESISVLCKRILELDRKATKGPWRYDMGNWEVEHENRSSICQMGGDDIDGNPVVKSADDGDLIAEYRTLAPQIAKRALVLEERIAKAREYLESIRDTGREKGIGFAVQAAALGIAALEGGGE